MPPGSQSRSQIPSPGSSTLDPQSRIPAPAPASPQPPPPPARAHCRPHPRLAGSNARGTASPPCAARPPPRGVPGVVVRFS